MYSLYVSINILLYRRNYGYAKINEQEKNIRIKCRNLIVYQHCQNSKHITKFDEAQVIIQNGQTRSL